VLASMCVRVCVQLEGRGAERQPPVCAQVVDHSESERPATAAKGPSIGDPSAGGKGPSPWVRASIGDAAPPQPKSTTLAVSSAQASEEVFSGGLRTECCWLNRRSHRFMATAAGVFAFLLFLTMSGLLGPSKYEYKDCNREEGQPCAVAAFYFNSVAFVFALVVAVVGCCGCCFCIPPNPEEENN
jgi:hypothetical protein